MENEGFGQRVKRTTMSILRKLLITIIVLACLTFAFLYWVTFDEGVMAGKVLRISKKGMIFKTYEGKLNIETFGALKGTSPISESYDFSVESSEHEVLKTLEEVSLSGERVNLRYKKTYVTFPWRGETNTFITGVQRSK
jgi:hypothetical protein